MCGKNQFINELYTDTAHSLVLEITCFIVWQEMKELAALAYRDTTSENREYWKSELSNALREIQVTYDDKLDTMRTEMETYYNMKVLK